MILYYIHSIYSMYTYVVCIKVVNTIYEMSFDKYTNIRYINLYVRYCIDSISSCIFSICRPLNYFIFFEKLQENCIRFFLKFSIIYYNLFLIFQKFPNILKFLWMFVKISLNDFSHIHLSFNYLQLKILY